MYYCPGSGKKAAKVLFLILFFFGLFTENN